MRVRLLGTAAGGGFPQWNCRCWACKLARSGDPRTSRRRETSVAVSADDRRWFLVGAPPVVRDQIEAFPPLGERDSGRVRGTAVAGILLANADVDHTAGLLLLREGDPIAVHASPAVRRSLSLGPSLDAMLGRYCGLEWRVPPARPGPLLDGDGLPSGLLYEAFPTPGQPPRYRKGLDPGDPGDGLGYRFTDPRTGGRLVVAPGVAAIDDDLAARLGESDVLLIDGTCWADDDLRDAGVGGPTASEMAHLPIGGKGGSLARISGLPPRRKVYIHINNTNPILVEGTEERRRVEAAAVEVGLDGMEFLL